MKMTRTAQRFVTRHPLSLREVIATPMIFRENVPGFENEPYPCVSVIRDLAEFAGYGNGALRTAMSRLKASGELAGFDDITGSPRFRLSAMQRSVSDVVRGWEARPEGLIVGVFSFRKEEETERRLVRDTLLYFGFKRIAQNTYITGMIDTSGLEAEIARAGVSERFFIFRCPVVDDPRLLKRLKSVFDLEGRAKELSTFLEELKRFLEEPGIDAMEFGRRIFFSGPAHHRKSFVEEPPLPRSLFPAGYPLAELRSCLGNAMRARAADVITYYRTLCG
jgi:DNA-binding transcriptional regulator PaaX